MGASTGERGDKPDISTYSWISYNSTNFKVGKIRKYIHNYHKYLK